MKVLNALTKGCLQAALHQLQTIGVAVIPHYYSEEEVVIIDENCSKALESSKDKPSHSSWIDRRAGAIRLKQLQLNYPILKRFGSDIFILLVNFIFSLRLQ